MRRLASEWAYARGLWRALRRTQPIARAKDVTVRELFERLARDHGDKPALLSDRENLSFRDIDARANRYARWFRAQGFVKGDVLALLMPNRPEMLCLWVGIAKAGGVTALINTNLAGPALAHCVRVVAARAILVDAALADLFEPARAAVEASVFMHGDHAGDDPRVDRAAAALSDAPLTGDERPPLTIDDRCLYIYTSGTTGLPKAANINHYRVQLAMHGFAAVIEATREDRIYNCLPMYHTVGGVVATGAALSVGGSCYIREKFSAAAFWDDIVRERCTIFVYIGELCRYLLAAPPCEAETRHRVRLCFGNGLRPDVFAPFRDRFGLRHIIEFYAATEGNVTLFNFDSTPGAIGRVPRWAARKFVFKIVRFDYEAETPVRDARGRCLECAAGEVGEAIGAIIDDPNRPTLRFEGYADAQASQAKIMRDVFAKGDAWFRSGDLMRKDARGYFYFIDRVGDTFRWKGENVSTTEVAETITSFPGVREASVYGVAAPGAEGRAGMAALVVEDPARFDFAGLYAFLATRLPAYARPLFIRLQDHIEVTATFKPRKLDLVAEGFDPARIADPLFFHDARAGAFMPLDAALFAAISAGAARL